MVVGVNLDGAALRGFESQSKVELAMYQGDELVDTMTDRPELVSMLGQYRAKSEDTENADQDAEGSGFHVSAVSLSDGGEVLVLIPGEDLERAARLRSLAVLASSLLLLGILLAVVALLTRSITRPLSNVLAVTRT